MHYKEISENRPVLQIVNKISSVCFGLASVILAIATIVMYFQSKGLQVEEFEGLVNYVYINTKSLPIKNINLRDQYCETGEEQVNLYKWRGTNQGCICNSALVRQDNCESCSIIKRTDDEILSKWQGKVFCIERLQGVMNKKDCINDNIYKSCNKDICIKISEQCPISNLFFEQTANLNTNEFIQWQTKTPKLFIKRVQNDDEYPLYDLAVSVDNAPCINMYKDSPRKDETNYPLYKSDYNCGIYGVNNEAEPINQTNYLQFLKDNGQNIEQLTMFQIQESNKQAILFTRRLITIQNTEKCYYFGINGFNKIKNDIIGSIQQIGFIHLIFKIIFMAIFVISFIIELCWHKGKIHLEVPFFTNILIVFSFFLQFIIMLEGAQEYVLYDKKQQIVNQYQNYGKNKCFNIDQINTFFENIPLLFTDSQENYHIACFVCMIWTSITGSFHFILLFIILCKKLKQTQDIHKNNADGQIELLNYSNKNKKFKKPSLDFDKDESNIFQQTELNKKNYYKG